MDHPIDQERPRCGWSSTDPLYIAYHDEEWGVPAHDDRHLFEMLVLEGAQAGLSWLTILRKRAAYRRAFRNFQPDLVARLSDADLEGLLLDEGIVRNRLKVWSARDNARAFLEVQREFGSFDAFLWSFVGGSPKVNRPNTLAEVPAVTPEAEALSKALKKRSFRFVGPTIMYAYMQAVGLVDDHLATCWKCRNR
jgi:DNA-3-methyladenine glycosylase I